MRKKRTGRTEMVIDGYLILGEYGKQYGKRGTQRWTVLGEQLNQVVDLNSRRQALAFQRLAKRKGWQEAKRSLLK